MILPIFLIFSLLSSFSYALGQDYCVGDLSGPESPAGYFCKKNVTIDDFVYSSQQAPAATVPIFNVSSKPVFVDQFPGLNGLGFSIALTDFNPGAVFPIHTHPAASEALLVVSGKITAGFISSQHKVFFKELNEGDVMLFPQGLLHFALNSGASPASAFVSFSSPRPGLQIFDFALFANDLPSELVSKTTYLDDATVKNLKAVFGGKN